MENGKLAQLKEKIANNPSFTIKEQVGYASGIFGNAMAQDSVETFADKFFRNFMGLDVKQMTILSNILMVLGFIVPPVSGNILDTPVRPDKRPPSKTILKFTPIPFALTILLLFMVPSPNPAKNFVYTVIVKLIYNTMDAFYDMSLNTMSLRMTTNAKDRKNFYTVATLASALGSMLPGWIIPIVVGTTDDASRQQWLYFIIALVFTVLGVASMYAPYFTLNEKIRVVERPEKEKINWNKQTVSTVLHSRSFMVIQIANFFEQVRQLSYKLLPYIYEDTFDDYQMKAGIDVISGTLSYVGLLAVPFITNRVSARTVMSGGYAYTGLFYALMGLFGLKFDVTKVRKKRWIIGVMIGLAGMPNNAISASKKVITGDATDYMEWYSEKKFGTPIHSEGLLCATQSLLGSVYNFIRTNLYNFMFGFIKYKEGTIKVDGKNKKAPQSDSTLKGIYLMFVLCGVIGNFLAAATYLFDNYTGKRKEEILRELQEMRAAHAQEAQ